MLVFKYTVTESFRGGEDDLTIADFSFECDAQEYVDFMNKKYHPGFATGKDANCYFYRKVDI